MSSLVKWVIVDPDTFRAGNIVIQDDRPLNGVKWMESYAEGKIWTGCDFISPSWTSYQFLNRFTSLERAAIRADALVNTDTADFLMLSQSAQEVIADDPVTLSGMQHLVSRGIITAERMGEILNG